MPGEENLIYHYRPRVWEYIWEHPELFQPFFGDLRIAFSRTLVQFHQGIPLCGMDKLFSFFKTYGLILEGEINPLSVDEPLPRIDPTPKYLPWSDLLTHRHQWQQEGLVIGVVIGSFDQPHPGHARLIRAAYEYCDRLIVGFDGDTALRVRKGPDRPNFPLAWRMWEIAGLPTYQARMQALNGWVVGISPDEWSSSSLLLEALGDDPSEHESQPWALGCKPFLGSSGHRITIKNRNSLAHESGYLRL